MADITTVEGTTQFHCRKCGYIMLFDPTTWAAYTGIDSPDLYYVWPNCPICQNALFDAAGNDSGGTPGDGR